MGVIWEREQRRMVFEAAMQRAWLEAITDADSEFDKPDAELWRAGYLKWINSDAPVSYPEIDKAGTPLPEYLLDNKK